MKYPKIGAGHRYRVAVSELSGGLNTRELPEKVPASQLTDCCNLWWKNGVLASRPGLKCLSTEHRHDGVDEFTARHYARTTIPVETGYGRPFADKCQRGFRFGYTGLNGEEWRNPTTLQTAAGSVWHIPFPAERLEDFHEGETDGSLWVTDSGQVFASMKFGYLFSLTNKLYKPLLLVGGWGAEGLYAPPHQPNGTALEAPNLLTGGFRARYTTDGVGKIFYLPKQGLDADRPVMAVYTRASGQQVTHTVPAGADSGTTEADGLVMHCIRWKGCVYFTQPGSTEPVAPEGAGISDNLEITAYKTDPKAAPLIGRMRFSCWFGGDYSGLGGGTRLFVAGHPLYPNRVYWSDVGNPLYFPENNYLLVGDAGEPVTAFAKQGNQLIIFKEREIYTLTYGAATLKAEGAAATATGPAFGLSQLHSGVGCDCPDTIALCSNRLVWLNSDGRVYMLSGVNAFSQSNVRPLSSPIEPALAKLSKEDLCRATAGCFEGRYLLLADNKIYLFRYEDNGFQQYTAAPDDEKAQRRLGWYIWDLSGVGVNFVQLLAEGVQTVLIGYRQSDGLLMRYRLEGDWDEWMPEETVLPLPIASRFRTALLRLPATTGEEDFRRVRQVYMGVGQPRGGRLQVWYHDGDRTCQDSFTLETPPPDPASPASFSRQVRRLRLTPHMVRTDQFGMTVACQGPVLVDGITVYYG